MTKHLRHYESIIIVNSSLHEDTLNRIVQRSEEIIRKNGGTLIETERWGKRRLAYPINKFQYGFYIIFHFESPASLVLELEREYRLNENILRFLTLIKDARAIRAYEKRKEAETAEAAPPETPAKEEKKEEKPDTAEKTPEKEATAEKPKEEEPKEEKPAEDAAEEKAPESDADSEQKPDSEAVPAAAEDPKDSDTEPAEAEKTGDSAESADDEKKE